MNTELISFAKRYRRLLNVFSGLVMVMPKVLRPAFIFTLGRWMSPFEIYADKILSAINLALPNQDAKQIWNKWRDSHGRFVLDFLTYRKFDTTWLQSEVCCSDEPALEALQQSGGLLLTYHTHHQNTLCCAFGLKGIKVSAVATAPDDSPLFPYIGAWATQVNVDSAMHFNGGTYIFTSNLRTLLSTTQKLLERGEVVVSLCDFHQPKAESAACGRLFDRSISPPTGVIEIALRHQVPIFLALFAPVQEKLHLEIKRLTKSDDVDAVVDQYFSFLESNIRTNPACWQGWEWFEDLPKTIQSPI